MKVVFTTFGFLFTGLGVVGVFLPLLPSVPFLLLAALCFSKGSERFHQWFISTDLYKKHLEAFQKEAAMPLKTKVILLLFSSSMLLVGIYHAPYLWLKVFLLFLLALKYYFFLFRIKTLR